MSERVPSHLFERAAMAVQQSADVLARCVEPAATAAALLSVLRTQLPLQRSRILVADINSGEWTQRYSGAVTSTPAAAGATLSGALAGAVELATTEMEALWQAEASRIARLPNMEPRSLVVPIRCREETLGLLVAELSDDSPALRRVTQWACGIVASMLGPVLSMENKAKTEPPLQRSAPAELGISSSAAGTVYGIWGQSQVLRNAIDKALRAANSDATILMTGESGCGKERFARMIHLASTRRDNPFVCVNCAAIPKELLESELFGHEKGSFTGAVSDRLGKFELAANGTLFLDEIADMRLDLQAKLLRALQDKIVQRVGSNRETVVDVRIIAATNRSLDELVNQGQFRLDLYFRLNVLKVHLPPLRERDGDIRLLALYFLTRENQRYRRNIVLSSDALLRLETYDWPGNVRQLENVIERAVIMADQDLIMVDEIDSILEEESNINLGAGEMGINRLAVPVPQRVVGGGPENVRPYQRVSDTERQLIDEALRYARGNKTLAARQLGLTPRQLHYRLAKLGMR